MKERNLTWKQWLRWRPKAIGKKLAYASAGSLILGLTGYFLLPFAFPIPDSISSGPEHSIILLDHSGKPLHHWVRKDYYRHRATALEELPNDLIHATLAAEDKRFFAHGGVDFYATARAIRDSWDKGSFVSGASTITQQTVKIGSKKSNRSLTAKISECLTARHLEMTLDKNEILTSYFNHLDYGNRNQGPLQAARHYFGKPLDQLSLAECALLAALPQAPSRLNPRNNPEAAIKRRNWILDRMATIYDLPQSRIDRAKKEPLKLQQETQNHVAPHLAQIMNRSEVRNNETQSIRTSIVSELQHDVTDIVRTHLKTLSTKHIQHAAVIIIDNSSGKVITHIGSPYFDQSNSGEIDAALTPRSPGSALKPFTYLLAFERGGMTPASILPDIPTHYPSSLGTKTFVNYSRRHTGPVTIHHALANSLNVPAVRLLNKLGGPAPLHKTLQNFGIKSLTESPSHYGLGLTLGSGDLTLLELTNAYAGLARMGSYLPPSYLANSKNSLPTQHASYQSCWMLAEIMSNNNARSAAFGPNSSLKLPFSCAVKTGTSTDFRDNWCLGYTKDFTVGVWVGNLDNTPMRGVSGVSGAGPIFQASMLRLYQDQSPSWFTKPKGLVDCHIHQHTGKQTAHGSTDTLLMSLPKNRLALASQDKDFDESGRVILDARYTNWLEQEADTNRFALNQVSQSIALPLEVLKIISPPKQAHYLLDPDLPKQGKTLLLQTNFHGSVSWSSATLTIQDHQGGYSVTLTPGEHQITLKDDQGRTTSRSISVEEL